MAVIETKYGIGDVVFHAGTTQERKQHPCPDCMGSRQWTAVSPAGTEYTFRCPRCAANYQSNDALNLNYTSYVPYVVARTIGSVQYNSHPGSYDHGARYMCAESGIGSGSVYNEDDLFATHDEAMAAATLKAASANSTHEHVVALYNKTLELSDYQLGDAMMEAARKQASINGQLLWNVTELFDTIKQADSKEAMIEAVEEYEEYSRKGDLSTLIEVADAARAEVCA